VGETLKLYLDQMIPAEVAPQLRDQGYDVLRASETGQDRADDQQILQKTISEDRILLTLDEHFGDWVILPLSRHPGVIRLKVTPTTSRKILNLGKACKVDSYRISDLVLSLSARDQFLGEENE
jgi:predicted nuclease of predicted toxin-antitoxin system